MDMTAEQIGQRISDTVIVAVGTTGPAKPACATERR